MDRLGDRIRLYRQRSRISQTELAGSDLSPSYISLIETGKRHPSESVLATLAERLGCTVGELTDGPPHDEAAARLDLAFARLALTNSEHDAARDRLQRLLGGGGLSRAIEHDALNLLAEAHRLAGDFEEAIRIRQPLFELCCTGRSHLPVAEVGHPLAHVYLSVGDAQAAVRAAERAAQHSQEAGQAGTDSHHKLEATLMMAYFEVGDLSLAWNKATQLMEIADTDGSTAGLGAACWNAALVAESRGDVRQALHLSERALALFSEQGVSLYVLHLQLLVAWMTMAADAGRANEAAVLLDECLPRLKDLGGSPETSNWEALRALAHFLQGEFAPAETLARRAVLHLRETEDHRETAEALLILGDVLTAQKRDEEGLTSYRAAVETLQRGTPTHRSAAVYRDLAQRFDLAGDADTGRECLHRALDIAHVHGNATRGKIAFGLRQPARPGTDPQRIPPALSTSWS